MRILGFATLIIWLSACSNGANSDSGLNSENMQLQLEEVKQVQTDVEQNVSTPMTEERAKQLAARHLALRQWRWGRPHAVSEDEDNYYVAYETPERERRLIGERVLLVSKDTGVVKPRKRR